MKVTTGPENRAKFTASSRRIELADLVGYGRGEACCGDDTNYIIQRLLIQEMKRLQSENARLAWAVKTYLGTFENEHGSLNTDDEK